MPPSADGYESWGKSVLPSGLMRRPGGAVELAATCTIGLMDGSFSLIPAEAGWRALFADDQGAETGRSRVIAWGSHEQEGVTRIVGIIADPNDPKVLVAADTVVDEDGGSLSRYGFVG